MEVNGSNGLGLMIRGGAEYGLGIFITGVDANSAANKAGLQVRYFVLYIYILRLFRRVEWSVARNFRLSTHLSFFF